VLIKGGHRQDDMEAVDLLLDVDGETLLRAPRVDTINTHGAVHGRALLVEHPDAVA